MRWGSALQRERQVESPVVHRRIVCASDLRDAGDEAIRQAGLLARAHGAALEVLHVVPNRSGEDPAGGAAGRHLGARASLETRARARSELTARVAALADVLPGMPGVYLTVGSPATEIVRRAHDLGADLIVVGGGIAGGARTQGGEVAESVVRHAGVPVLVARRGPGSGQVLAATDLSDPSVPALAAAAWESRRCRARLTVLHNVDPELKAIGSEMVATLLRLFSDEVVSELGRAARRRLEEELDRLGVEGEAVITCGSTGAAILRLARALPADLVVVGSSLNRGLAGVLFGSVAEIVAKWAPCSVLVVRRRD